MGDISFDFGHNRVDDADPWGDRSRADKNGEGSRTLTDSSALSELQEITCSQVLKMVRQTTDTVRKAYRMPPKPTSNSKGRGNTAPAPAASEGGGDFAPFLKINNLIKSKVLKIGQKFSMSVTGAREAGKDNFSDVFVDVKIGKNEYTWGLTADKKAYAALYERFGGNLDKWRGTVKCELSEPYKKGYNPSIVVL